MKQKIQDRISWLKDTADDGTPPYADLRIEELKVVLKQIDEVTKQIQAKSWTTEIETGLDDLEDSSRQQLVSVKVVNLKDVLAILDSEPEMSSIEEKAKTLTEWFKHFRDNNIPTCGGCPNPRTEESCSDCEQVLAKSPKLVRLSDTQRLEKRVACLKKDLEIIEPLYLQALGKIVDLKKEREERKQKLQQIFDDFGDISDYDNDDVIDLHKALLELLKE